MNRGRRADTKVPELTVYFWAIKILSTGMGEATSDFFARRYGPLAAVPIAALALGIALVLQFSARSYVAWIYWLAVVMVSVFGTMAADGLHVELGVPYDLSTPFFAIVLGVVLFAWHATEKTLSIHTIYTPRREAFYWATVMVTFALGTAAGDLTATTLGLGYLASGVLFAAVFAIPAIGYRRLGWNEVFSFWFAYILTRPLGASFADFFAVPPSRGGLGWGPGLVALLLTIVIVALVAYLTVTRKDISTDGLELQA